MSAPFRRSRGNVFGDLGFSEGEAENLRVRALLMSRLDDLIRQEGWTQREAARTLGVTQPRISDRVRGRIDRFSVDPLIDLLGRGGVSVTFSTRKRRHRVA